MITTGADARWLNIPSEQRLRGKGVSACATCDGFFFKNKVIGVVGGGDSAMEEALVLTKFASKVYVIHRKNTFRASKIMQDRVMTHPKIEVIWNAGVSEVVGDMNVQGVNLSISNDDQTTSKTRNLPLQGLFIAIGHTPSTAFLQGSNVQLDKKGYILTSAMVALGENRSKDFNYNYQYMTSVPGVFAAGDCVDHVYRQAATAVGMGVAAELEVERYLNE